MEHKMLVRYLILIGILIICAGAAWFFTNASDVHQENAVLALYEENRERDGKIMAGEIAAGERPECQMYSYELNFPESVADI